MQHVYPESLVTVFGVVYAHRKTFNGGDLYLTRYGMQHESSLNLENWYDPKWFTAHRERLEGTSSVYRLPTKPVCGKSLDLVVKNCRVGEDVPGDTQTLLEFLHAEFNSPWEEFSLTTELREGKFGNPDVSIQTQDPLAIYVPPETMQHWQSGRSKDRMKRVKVRHPGIDIDILRQYKLVYGWIHGKDLVDCLRFLGVSEEELLLYCTQFTGKSIATLAEKGFAVADMKSSHIIIGEAHVEALHSIHETGGDGIAFLEALIEKVQYSVIDYELLTRTGEHNIEVSEARRQTYLNDQRDRFTFAPLPHYLNAITAMGVPYVFGHSESTGGLLWVVGRNGELFDYFIPERWRCTHWWGLSKNTDIYYTLSKDNIHLVWKTSRVGETPQLSPGHPLAKAIAAYGYNSPFEEFSIAHDLANQGVGAVYVRAIYRTGSTKIVPNTDMSRYLNHAEITLPDGTPLLQSDYNYISLRGYFNGGDDWVAAHSNSLCHPIDLAHAVEVEYVSPSFAEDLMGDMLEGIHRAGYDGEFLSLDDFLLAVTPEKKLLRTEKGAIDMRICNFEFIKRRV